jgi:hypothetical protein
METSTATEISTVNKSLSPPITDFERIIDARDRTVTLVEEGIAKLAEAVKICPGQRLSLASALSKVSWYSDDIQFGHLKRLIKAIDTSAWDALFRESRLTTLMNRDDIAVLRNDIDKHAPPVTREVVMTTFVDLFSKRHETFRTGLVDLFQGLCRVYRSNKAFSIGKRIILDRVLNEYGWSSFSYGSAKVNDLWRIMLLLDGRDPGTFDQSEQFDQVILTARRNQLDNVKTEYFEVRLFKNGNLHIWFQRPDLIDKANQLIAEHYGAVLAHE